MRFFVFLLIAVLLGALAFLVVRYGELWEHAEATESNSDRIEDPGSSPAPQGGTIPDPPPGGTQRNPPGPPDPPVGIQPPGAPGPVDAMEDRLAHDMPARWVNPIDGSEMILVRAGTFVRGSNSQRNGGNEGPQHNVYVKSFYLSRTEVSRAQYAAFMEAGGYTELSYWSQLGYFAVTQWGWQEPLGWDTQLDQLDHPAAVSWFEADAYARWAGGMLPSESQWEKAARGYNGDRYPTGASWNPEACNWLDAERGDTSRPDHQQRGVYDGYQDLAPVGAFADVTTPFGILNMAGNVFEYTADWYEVDFFRDLQAAGLYDPDNSATNEGIIQRYKVLKGGSFLSEAVECLGSYRKAALPHDRPSTLEYGLRLAMSVRQVRELMARSERDARQPLDELLADRPHLSRFFRLLEAAELTGDLNDDGDWTVLAAHNAGFTQDQLDMLLGAFQSPVAAVRNRAYQIAEAHILPDERVTHAELAGGMELYPMAAVPNGLSSTVNNGAIRIGNQPLITGGDLVAENGILHEVGGLIVPDNARAWFEESMDRR